MQKSEYEKILLEISEISNLVLAKREAKKAINRLNRRIGTIEKNYSFLSEIVAIGNHNKHLEYSLKKYFKSLELFNRVDWLPKSGSNEDLRIWTDECVIIVDVNGNNKPSLSSAHIHKVGKYIVLGAKIKSMNGFSRRGLVIVNHDNTKHYLKRAANPFTDKTDLFYAEQNNIGLVTTVELVKGYIKLKKGEITKEDFQDKITTNGIIHF